MVDIEESWVGWLRLAGSLPLIVPFASRPIPAKLGQSEDDQKSLSLSQDGFLFT